MQILLKPTGWRV